jgi:hypothetical protein
MIGMSVASCYDKHSNHARVLEILTGIEGSVWFSASWLGRALQVSFKSSRQVDVADSCTARKYVFPLQILPVPVAVSIRNTRQGLLKSQITLK